MADSVIAAIGLPFDEAYRFFEGKIRKTASGDHASWAEVYGAEHARAFTVAGAASDALLADFQAEIGKAIRNGTTLADFRGKFDEIVAKHGWQQRHEPGWRAKIIYETNMATAHAAGRYAQMTDPDVLEAYPYWQVRALRQSPSAHSAPGLERADAGARRRLVGRALSAERLALRLPGATGLRPAAAPLRPVGAGHRAGEHIPAVDQPGDRREADDPERDRSGLGLQCRQGLEAGRAAAGVAAEAAASAAGSSPGAGTAADGGRRQRHRRRRRSGGRASATAAGRATGSDGRRPA